MDLGRLKSDTLLVLIGNGFLGGAGLMISMLLTRILTPEEVGIYFLIFQVVNVARLFSEAGMNVGLQKLVGVSLADGALGRVKAYGRGVFLLLGVTSLVACGALALGWGGIVGPLFDEPGLTPFLGVALIWLAMRGAEDLGNVFFRSLREIPQAVLGCGVPRQLLLLALLGGLWLSYGALGLSQTLWVVTGTWVFGGLIALALVARRLGRIDAPAEPAFPVAAREILTLSLPMLLHTGATVVLSAADVWVLGAARSTAEVGIYSTLMRVATSMAFLVGVVNMVLPPVLARLHREGKRGEMEAILRRTAVWGAALAIPMAVVFIAFGGPVLGIVFGDAYAAGGVALGLLALAHGFNAAAGSPGYVLQMTGGHVLLMRLTVGVALCNLVGNLLLVGPYGMEGVALVTAVSLIAQNVIMTTVVYRRLGIKTWIRAPWRWGA